MPTRTVTTDLVIHPIAHDAKWLESLCKNNPNRIFFVSETKYEHLLRLHYAIKNTTPAGEKSYEIKAEVLLRNDPESSAEKIIEKLIALGVLYKSLLFDDKTFLSFALKTYQVHLLAEEMMTVPMSLISDDDAAEKISFKQIVRRQQTTLPRTPTPCVALSDLADGDESEQTYGTFPRSR